MGVTDFVRNLYELANSENVTAQDVVDALGIGHDGDAVDPDGCADAAATLDEDLRSGR